MSIKKNAGSIAVFILLFVISFIFHYPLHMDDAHLAKAG